MTEKTQEQLWTDFDIFSRAIVATRDVDPVYDIVEYICDTYSFDREWFTFVYVSFYSLASAIEVCKEMPTPGDYKSDKFIKLRKYITHFGHERRGSGRNPYNQVQYLDAVVEMIVKRRNVFKFNNTNFRKWIQKNIPMVGGWAAFKIAEVLAEGFDYDKMLVTDMGLAGKDPMSNDGPVGGLRWVCGRDIQYTKSIFPTWEDLGAKYADKNGWTIGEVETCFCKFHKLVTGKYFVGHDIQEFLDLQPHMDGKWDGMMKPFPEELWKGKIFMEKDLKKVYRDTGEIRYSDFGDKASEASILNALHLTFN